MVENNKTFSDFTLRFPFQFGLGIDFPNLENNAQTIENLSFRLYRLDSLYVIEIKGFESTKAAEEYLNRIWAGMAWVSLNTGIPFSSETILGNVTYAQDPKEAARNLSRSFGIKIEDDVHGLASGPQDPIVYPSNKNIRSFNFSATATSSHPLSFNDIFSFITEIINETYTSGIILKPKLKTAFELYTAHYYEISLNAKFLTLVMALEILFKEKSKSKNVLTMIDGWKSQLNDLLINSGNNSDDLISLEELDRELFYRKSNSKRSQMRYLIRETFSGNEKEYIQELEKKAIYIYDKRSELVHDGILPAQVLNDVVTDARSLVEKVLKSKFTLHCRNK